MKDRQPTKVLANGAIRYGIYREDGTLDHYEYMKREDAPTVEGTPLNKANLLSDATAAKVWRADDAPEDPMPDDAFEKLTEPRHRVGDTLTTVLVLSAPWHACDGSTFDQTAYPDLYAVLSGTTLPSISYSSDTTTYIKMADD